MPYTLDLAYPFTGSWLVQNSPADRVPSHGTARYATTFAIDFVPVDASGRSAPISAASLWRPESPEHFPGFGRPILAPVSGVVVASWDAAADHDAFRGLPSIGYALTQARRAAGGWRLLAGNHVMIQTRDGPVVALCHLQQSSSEVVQGQRVEVGSPVGRCGNTGNSTEPHLHLQVMSSADVTTATPLPVTFRGRLPSNREVVQAE